MAGRYACGAECDNGSGSLARTVAHPLALEVKVKPLKTHVRESIGSSETPSEHASRYRFMN